METSAALFTGSTYMSALEVGGFVGSLASGFLTDRAVARVSGWGGGGQTRSLLLFQFHESSV